MTSTEDRDLLPPEIEGERIAGNVEDFEGHPLVGVRVEAAATGGAELDLLPTMTDGEGRFLLEGLDASSRYDLRFAIGRVSARTLAVPAGTSDLRVRLARPQGLLLVVKTPAGEAPPDLLHVVLERESARGWVREYEGRHLTTRMLLWSIRPGRYQVAVWGGTWLPVTASGIEVVEKEKAPVVEILLSAPGANVAGRVLDASEQPRAGALVTWRRIDVPDVRLRHLCTASADEQGRFAVSGLPAGAYRFSAGLPEGPFIDREVAVTGEEEVSVDLMLPS